ncbi:MAG: hypothetical protein ACJ75J_07965 [Cytophagaceae bacterium]
MNRIFFCLFLLFVLEARAQKFPISLEAGVNGTKVLHHSKYDLTGDASYSLPFLGYFYGLAGRYTLKQSAALKISVQAEKRSIRQSLSFTDANNNSLGNSMSTTSNSYLNMSILYLLRADKKFQVGVGINNHLLLFSTTRSQGLNGQQLNGYVIKTAITNNHYFKTYNISIPVQLSLNGSRMYGFITADFGVFSRIKGNKNYFGQTEYTGQIGMGYRFKKLN